MAWPLSRSPKCKRVKQQFPRANSCPALALVSEPSRRASVSADSWSWSRAAYWFSILAWIFLPRKRNFESRRPRCRPCVQTVLPTAFSEATKGPEPPCGSVSPSSRPSFLDVARCYLHPQIDRCLVSGWFTCQRCTAWLGV